MLGELLREDTSPDGSSDGRTDSSADGSEHTLDSEDSGNLLMGGSGHGSHLLTDDKGSPGESDEDLAHDDVSNVDVWLTKLDHETNTEDGERNTEVKSEPLEVTRPSNVDTDDEGEEARSDTVDVGNITCLSDIKSVDDLEEGGEVTVPDVEFDEENSTKKTSSKDSAVGKKRVFDVSNWCKVFLVNGKESQEHDTENDHADDHRGFPAKSLVRVQVEWEEEERKTTTEEENTEDIELNGVVLNRLEHGSATVSWLDQTILLGLVLIPPKEEE